MQQIEIIAEQFRLKTRLDECGDKIIPGKRGHLNFDGSKLCLMVIDAGYVRASRWQALGAEKLWLGDVGRNGSRRIQDVKIVGIPESSWPLAIRLARCPIRRTLSPEETARLKAVGHKLQAIARSKKAFAAAEA
jgi:hypothetical protein